jgi:peptide chain release factor 2
MADYELTQQASQLRDVFQAISGVLDSKALTEKIVELEAAASDPGLWDDQARAQQVTGELSRAKSSLETLAQIKATIDDLDVLIDMAGEDAESGLEREIASEISSLQSKLAALEIETLLNGEYDSRGAVVTIRSGAGGDDATDFAEMLMRMYLRYAEKQSMKAQVLDVSHAEGAGIKSATFEIDSPYAYGNLSVESGTHRLVRMSPFNSAGKRQTSFAAVEVVPLVAQTDAVEVSDSEIRIDVFRSSGPGGQSVNTTDSAVRITHIPTGIVVSCQNEKSQLQNKAAAMRVLQSRLLELKRQEEDAKKKQMAGDVKASWGEQMRSYVLAPYQMVKDLRTGYEVNNPSDVFDGELEGFIAAGIRWRKQQEATHP